MLETDSLGTPDLLAMYTFAFVAFDHAGLAAKIVEGTGFKVSRFWEQMRIANDRESVRGQPRRYFRGDKATKALNKLESMYLTPLNALRALAGDYDVAKELIVLDWPHFGPTAAWKMCDMAERVCSIPVMFNRVTLDDIITNEQVRKGVEKAIANEGESYIDFEKALMNYKWASRAPPRYDRALNAQEWETILCYYSHDAATNKHLPGMDKQNIRKELDGWGHLAVEITREIEL